jgi:ubiquinone/menaquinone biosynthesis C-methylase UbiE
MGKAANLLRAVLPGFMKRSVGRLLPTSVRERHKHSAELQFWRQWVRENGPGPETEYYRKFMLDMGGVADAKFFEGRVCIDIGCGPMGSLTWLTNARAAIGLDPLASRYAQFGIAKHTMTYICAGAEELPLADASVDVVFAMNSLDHVRDAPTACREIRRVLRPGGCFIGSLNLEEAPSLTEPWRLTEKFLDEHLFAGWEKQFYKIRPKVLSTEHFGPYRYFYEDCPAESLDTPGPRALWCRVARPRA